jgi:hypothetical protein
VGGREVLVVATLCGGISGGRIAYPFMVPARHRSMRWRCFRNRCGAELLIHGVDAVVIQPGAIDIPSGTRRRTSADLMYRAAGAQALCASSPLERAFRDVHAIARHIGMHDRVMKTAGRVLFGPEPDTPLS